MTAASAYKTLPTALLPDLGRRMGKGEVQITTIQWERSWNEEINSTLPLFFFLSLKKLYFIDHAKNQLSWFFLLCPPPPIKPYSLRQSPYHCSCPWVMPISSLESPFPILYFTSPWLFCNLFVLLIPLPLHSFSPLPSYLKPTGN